MGDTSVSQENMRRGLAEQDVPNVFDEIAIREVYKVNGNKPMDFRSFGYAMMFYNRFTS